MEDKIKIKSFFYKKDILYSNIKNLVIRKNYLGSYDIIINFNDSKNMFKYLSNYIFNISIRKNDGYSFIICDVKNICEIENYILKKMNCYELKKKTYIYIRYSLFDSFAYTLIVIFSILYILNLSLSNILLKYLVYYLIFINIKFFKNKFYMNKINCSIIKISDKKNRCYVFEGYNETEKEIKINYGLKINFNYYYLSFYMFPIKYKKVK